ncbi:MAG: VWA domain-containing protein, partial [Deltaproteobacteria bacterium]
MRLPAQLVPAALVLALSAAFPASSVAAEPEGGAAADAKPAEVDRCRPTDIIFLIDNSASFTGARAQVKAYADGAREFLESLGAQHRISMIKFGVGAEVMVQPIFNTPDNRDTLVTAIEDLRMNEPWTDVYAGVDQAFRNIRVDEDRRGVILMISDGVISMPGPNGRESDDVKAQQKQWIDSRLPDAKKINAAFFTVAYENKWTDYALMQKIADGTGGFSAKGDNASLADTMRKVAVEMCARDPIPVRAKPTPKVTTPAVTPPPAPTPPVTLTPVPPPPVGP